MSRATSPVSRIWSMAAWRSSRPSRLPLLALPTSGLLFVGRKRDDLGLHGCSGSAASGYTVLTTKKKMRWAALTAREERMASVAIRDVRKAFGATPVIHGVDISIRDGEFVVLVGPSGCGKSTLLRMIAGLENITGGEIR